VSSSCVTYFQPTGTAHYADFPRLGTASIQYHSPKQTSPPFMKRLFFDITYTRVQRENVGIIRTVRRLLEEFQAGAVPTQAIVFTRNEFHEISASPAGPRATAVSAGWLFRLATSGAGKLVTALLTHLPWRLFRPLWEFVSSRAYATAVEGAAPARLRPGDLVLLCDACWNYGVWVAAKRARAQGAQVVLVVYDIMPLRHPEFCAPLVVPVFKGWLSEMLACTDALVCISAATEHDLRQWASTNNRALPPTGHFRLGSDPGRPAAGSVVRPEIRSFLAASPCFAAVGSIEPKKNYEFLLEVFDAVWAQGSEVRLLIAGRPTVECHGLLEKMRTHPQSGIRLMLVSDASDAEVAHIYAACRALVFSSLMEGFGLPLVEARAKGCPVIAGDLPVFVELADEGVFLYPRNSALGLQALLSAHAREDCRPHVGTMRPFLWSDSSRQCLEVIGQLLPSAR
jgi:glycosyltransferase involved in cell wall biosynthesis